MKPLSEHLTQLIDIAEYVMRRPAQHIVRALPPGFAASAAEIRRVHALAEATRTTRAGIVMCEAIEGFAADARDYHWQMLIGATLPLLRREAYLAFCNERELVRDQ